MFKKLVTVVLLLLFTAIYTYPEREICCLYWGEMLKKVSMISILLILLI
jgi:hypothetical protein